MEITDPITDELVDTNDIDQMLESFERVNQRSANLSTYLKELRTQIAVKTSESDERTQYIQGEHYECKVEQAAETWDQSALKRIWNKYPGLSQSYLRIERLAPNMHALNKLRRTTPSSSSPLVYLKEELLSACQGIVRLPRITITKRREEKINQM